MRSEGHAALLACRRLVLLLRILLLSHLLARVILRALLCLLALPLNIHQARLGSGAALLLAGPLLASFPAAGREARREATAAW